MWRRVGRAAAQAAALPRCDAARQRGDGDVRSRWLWRSDGGGAMGVQIFVEPAAGETPILHAVESAQRSVWVEVYLLTDTNVIHALEDAAQRGVDVRVLLEPDPYGSGATSPQQTLQELQAAGVQAKDADPAFHYTHEKALIIDGATLFILTANLTKSGLGGTSYAANREYGVIDTTAADVAEATASSRLTGSGRRRRSATRTWSSARSMRGRGCWHSSRAQCDATGRGRGDG